VLIAICAGLILDRMLLGHSALNGPDSAFPEGRVPVWE
jgi:hypothetical protein